MRLFHGGVPGLAIGDLLTGGHDRAVHENCKFCEARAKGEAHLGLDGPSEHDAVYATPNRLYAKHYASLWGRGDLYGVILEGPMVRSTEDTIETWHAPAARIVAVLDRCVVLTDSERRRMFREWVAADHAADPARASDPLADERMRRQLGMARAPDALTRDRAYGLGKLLARKGKIRG